MKLFCRCVLICALAASVRAEDDRPIRTMIIALEKAWNQAYRSRDGRALGEIFSDSIVIVNVDGRLQSKSEFLAEVTKSKPFEIQQSWPESITVQVLGDIAIASGVFQQKGKENGKSYIRRNRFIDTWVRTTVGWRCVAASATPILQ
jgi:ketosteroid isomerase-like protein